MRRPPLRSLVLALLLAAAVAACRDDHAVLPAPAGPARAFSRVAESEPVELGTYDLPFLNYQHGWNERLPVVLPPGRHRVRVRVEGGIHVGGYYEGPGACYHPFRGVPTTVGPLGSGFPEGHPYRMEVSVWLEYPGGGYRVLRPASVSADSLTVVYEAETLTPGILRWARPARIDCLYLGEAGRMVSSSQRAVVTAIPLRDAPAVRVELLCQGDRGPNAVTRGREIACQVRREPGDAPGELAVTAWSFDGTPRQDGDPASTTWQGVMARAGTVSVTATLGGAPPETRQAAITVHDRDWSAKGPLMDVREVDPCNEVLMRGLPEIPEYADELGYIRFFDRECPDSLLDSPAVEIEGGPNHGLYYAADLRLPVYARYRLNRVAMQPGSLFALKQEVEASDSRSRQGGLNWCSRSVVRGLLDLVLAHELKHAEVYEAAFKREMRPHAERLERMADENSSTLDAAFDDVFPRVDPVAVAESEAIHQQVAAGNPWVVTPFDLQGRCALRNASGQELRNQPSQ